MHPRDVFEVYNELGTGFPESVYHTALAQALAAAPLHIDREVPIDVFFRHAVIGRFAADLVVENRVIVEVMAVRRLLPEHQAQLLHYLRATAMEVGLTSGPGRSSTG
jgi:GxxExxY protein